MARNAKNSTGNNETIREESPEKQTVIVSVGGGQFKATRFGDIIEIPLAGLPSDFSPGESGYFPGEIKERFCVVSSEANTDTIQIKIIPD